MHPKPFVLPLDMKAFAQSGEAVAGQKPLAAFPRLLAETGDLGAGQVLDWHARAEVRLSQAGEDQIWLHLRVNVTLPLICQRCLDGVDVPLNLVRSFRFVESEALAWAQDEVAQEDVLALSQEFDLVALIEDEVLMGRPLIARHEVCSGKLKWSAQDPDFEDDAPKARHPFAVLSKLQTGRSD